jgi:hypothetical protein
MSIEIQEGNKQDRVRRSARRLTYEMYDDWFKSYRFVLIIFYVDVAHHHDEYIKTNQVSERFGSLRREL